MCRLFALTSDVPKSPMLAIEALDVMKEGHDGSGVGLYLTDLGGIFGELKEYPILSGIFTREGMKTLDSYLMPMGFKTKYNHSIKVKKEPPPGIPKRYMYHIRAYEYPEDWEDLSFEEKAHRLMMIRLKLREIGQKDESMIVYSFWPDSILLKEIGDPMEVAEYLDLDNIGLKARIIMAQGRQNTNYAINLYACHPFFIQGVASMTNGENTAFVPIREFLESRGFPGYRGYQSDSEVFTHIFHYMINFLGLPVEFYKHIITPLKDEDIEKHPNSEFLRRLKHSCRRLIIDGPNCVIGCLPDKTVVMVQDRKKLRPGVVGGKKGFFVFSSEICGLDYVLKKELGVNNFEYFQPMYIDTVYVTSDRKEVIKCSQMNPLRLPN